MNPLGVVIKTLNSWGEKETISSVIESFAKKSNTFQQYDELAKLCFDIKDYENAIKFGEKILSFPLNSDQEYILKTNLISAYNNQNYPDKALPFIKELKRITPNDPELIMQESFAYSGINEKEKCEEILFQVLEMPNASKEIKDAAWHNLSGHYFRQDNVVEGLRHYLREEESDLEKRYDYKKWDGTVSPNKTLIVDTKCGAGDEFIHIRFMKHLEDLGMKPIWTTTRKDLIKIFEYNGYNCIHSDLEISRKTEKYILNYDREVPDDAEWVYALAIPYYLKLTSKDLWYGDYIKPLPEKEEKYSYLKEDKNFKIGMFWASSSGFDQAHFRNTYLKDYMSVLEDSGHSLYSLQLPNETPEVNEYSSVIQFDDRKDFTDTVSIVNNMDLVITSCTSIAHIAGALGKEVCVFVPILDYYIWEHSEKNTYWYGPNVHLFRQTKPRVWDEQIQEFKDFMKERGLYGL
jgi:tetratricopeptide (TPR) repeat protein